MHQEYIKLIEQLKKIKVLESIEHLLNWDLETMMPKKGVNHRADQNAELSIIIHQKKTAKSFETSLDKCINIKTGKIKLKGLAKNQEASLNLIREDYLKAKKIPSKMVKELAKLRATSSTVWAQAKEDNRFDIFLPYLEKMVSFMQKQAEYLGYEDHPYDALIDQYEPKMTVKMLDKLFKDLRPGLVDLVKQIQQKPKSSEAILKQSVEAELQLKFCRQVAQYLGLSADVARLDTSSHPFCESLCPTDIRMTTRIKPNAFFDAIYSTLHESGHGLYESGLPLEEFGSPLSEYCSLGIHESQSRLFETFIGQSRPFIRFLSKKIQGILPNSDPDELYQAINIIEPSFIRTESDEVTYCLHVMLRYEIEKQLISGELKVKDVPSTWNEMMKNYLGIEPTSDSQGCLQDVHWSCGLFGYFPTYALGNLYAGQLYERLHCSIKDIDQLISEGRFESIVEWLKNHIYRYGRERTPQNLIQSATHKDLNSEAYLQYLKNKYL